MSSIQIGNRKIGLSSPPFIVAEMSGNHNQSLEQALKIVDAVADAGADALKLQTYTPDTMTLNCNKSDFVVHDAHSLWNDRSLYDLYQEAHTPWQWHQAIFERCHQRGLIAFSSPFDPSAVDFLESLHVPCYKIASFELIDLPLIKKVAATKKPIILSTGMSSISEINEAVQTARYAGATELILLKCTSTYPASPVNSNLQTIPHMRDLFCCEVGLSDHTLGIGVSIASVAFGATFIERHVTLQRSDGGVDASFSLEPHELKQLVIESKHAWQSVGHISYQYSENESQSLAFRRSIYAVQDIQKGEAFTTDNIRIIRPGFGLKPKYFENIIGKKSMKFLAKGTALSWDYISNNET